MNTLNETKKNRFNSLLIGISGVVFALSFIYLGFLIDPKYQNHNAVKIIISSTTILYLYSIGRQYFSIKKPNNLAQNLKMIISMLFIWLVIEFFFDVTGVIRYFTDLLSANPFSG